MKLFEFEKILETSYFNTDNYGTWIDTKTDEIIPIGTGDYSDHSDHTLDHIDYLAHLYKKDISTTASDALYYKEFKDGLVRVAHDSRTLNI